jgi:hypothetical protein
MRLSSIELQNWDLRRPELLLVPRQTKTRGLMHWLQATANSAAGVAAASGTRANAHPRFAVACPGRPHERGCAIRRPLARNIDVHRLIVRHDHLRYHLLL